MEKINVRIQTSPTYTEDMLRGTSTQLYVGGNGIQFNKGICWTIEEVKGISEGSEVSITRDGLLSVSNNGYCQVVVKAVSMSNYKKFETKTVLLNFAVKYPQVVEVIAEYPQVVEVIAEYPQVVHSLTDTDKRHWLVFTGSQMIDTKTLSNDIDEVDYFVSIKDPSADRHIVCGTRASSSNAYRIYGGTAGNKWYYAYNSTTFASNGFGSVSANTTYHIHSIIRSGLQRMDVDGVTLKSDNVVFSLGSVKNYIGAWNGNGTVTAQFQGKLDAIKLMKDGALVRWFVPYQRNNQIGLLDILTNEMYLNVGTGSFTIITEDKQ